MNVNRTLCGIETELSRFKEESDLQVFKIFTVYIFKNIDNQEMSKYVPVYFVQEVRKIFLSQMKKVTIFFPQFIPIIKGHPNNEIECFLW